MNPFFTVLINTRNSSSKMGRCLDSLKTQNFVDWIALVTDDSSLDDTTAFIREAARTDKRFIPFYNNKRKGALNNTIDRLRTIGEGTVVVILDGDDYLYDENALRAIYEGYTMYPQTQMSIGGGVKLCKGEQTPLKASFSKENPLDSYFFCHCRTFRISLFREIPESYWKEAKEFSSLGNVDIVVNGYLSLLANHILIVDSPVYVWDINGDTPHAFEYNIHDTYSYDPAFQDIKDLARKWFFSTSQVTPKVISRFCFRPSLLRDLPIPTFHHTPTFLSSEVVYVISLYNPGKDKLLRCLSSIASQESSLRVGVLVYDDNSSFPNFHQIKSMLEELGIPYGIMSNHANRLKSHNLLQISRRVPLSPDTLLLFLDGDDYLPPKNISQIVFNRYKETGWEASLGNLEMDSVNPQNTRVSKILSSPFERIPLDFNHIWDISKCWAWLHLKACLFHLLNKVEEEFFTEEDNKTFLILGEDNFVFPRCLEKAAKKGAFEEILYVYDTDTGSAHENTSKNMEYVNRIRANKSYSYPRIGKPNKGAQKVLQALSTRIKV